PGDLQRLLRGGEQVGVDVAILAQHPALDRPAEQVVQVRFHGRIEGIRLARLPVITVLLPELADGLLPCLRAYLRQALPEVGGQPDIVGKGHCQEAAPYCTYGLHFAPPAGSADSARCEISAWMRRSQGAFSLL